MRALIPILAVVVLLPAFPRARQDAAPVRPSFEEFLDGLRVEARMRGISEPTVEGALTGLTPEPVVVARDRAQPEQTQSLDAYIAARLSTRTKTTARTMIARHRQVLERVQARYGVSSSVLVAIWGLESSFGQFTGSYPTIRALATLAFDGRRALFRTELFDALSILDRGDMPPDRLKGSWAGAMGQPQFMPSSFLRHAVDFDGNGQTDIWASLPDVFGSMANYLRNSGWTEGERWGREVQISREVLARVDRDVPMRISGCRAIREMTEPTPLQQWAELGVTLPTGAALPVSTLSASLVRGRNRNFLVYRNHEALLSYNCSNAYAITAGLLADSTPF